MNTDLKDRTESIVIIIIMINRLFPYLQGQYNYMSRRIERKKSLNLLSLINSDKHQPSECILATIGGSHNRKEGTLWETYWCSSRSYTNLTKCNQTKFLTLLSSLDEIGPGPFFSRFQNCIISEPQ